MLVIVVGKLVCVTKCEVKVVIVVDSLEMVMFSMEPESLLVDGDIVRNKDWVGLVY